MPSRECGGGCTAACQQAEQHVLGVDVAGAGRFGFLLGAAEDVLGRLGEAVERIQAGLSLT
jgi:hypothetical protein